MTPTVPNEADERRLIDLTKQAVAMVDGGLSPDAAIEKLARAENIGRGTIDLLAHAYNTGRQLHQFKSASSILDKLADFPLADAEKIAAAIYPAEVTTPKEAREATVVSAEYDRAPAWDEWDRRPSKAANDLAPLLKEANDRLGLPTPSAAPAATEKKTTIADFNRAKLAYETARRDAAAAEDQLRRHVGQLTDYFKQAECYRLPYAQVEHACQAYLPAEVDLLKVAYVRANLGARGRAEKTAADVPVQRTPFDLDVEPFLTIKAAAAAARLVHQHRAALVAQKTAYDQAAGATIRPFVLGAPAPKAPPSQPSSRGSEKAAFLSSPAMGGAVAAMLGRSLGDFPKTKNDLIEDAWLELEDPSHQNEIRKINAHTLLNSLMTDPDDPISSHDPDKVISAYNEIASMAPRLAEQPAALRPVLRRKLQGLSEPFEAKEMTDIEKGLAASKGMTPSSSLLREAPDSIMG